MDEVNYRYNNIKNEEDLVSCLAYAHHGIVKFILLPMGMVEAPDYLQIY